MIIFLLTTEKTRCIMFYQHTLMIRVDSIDAGVVLSYIVAKYEGEMRYEKVY